MLLETDQEIYIELQDSIKSLLSLDVHNKNIV